MVQTRRQTLRLGTGVLLGGLLAACQSAGGSPPAPSPGSPSPAGARGLDAVVAAANQEGTLAVFAAPAQQALAGIFSAFQSAYPNVNVLVTYGDPSTELAQVSSERQAGQYLKDLLINGTASELVLKGQGALAPLAPVLVMPEVLDSSAWLDNHLWWEDAAEPNTTLMFSAILATPLYVNTTLADPKQFTSYMDLLDPQWKGKIVSNDIRRIGPGGVPARFIYRQPAPLGPAWFTQLYGTQDVTISADQRQMVDWLAQGQYALALFISTDQADQATQQGLPVQAVPLDQFKEGGALAPSYGALALMDHAPHPNAAQLFANWLLSREGQTVWQNQTAYNSLRIDISKAGLNPTYLPNPVRTYEDGGSQAYADIASSVFNDSINQAPAQAGTS